jgi:hypothetical protein
VVIIGGSSGIGLAVAEEAASQGADVVIVSSRAERVQEAVRSIGGDVRGHAVDMSVSHTSTTVRNLVGIPPVPFLPLTPAVQHNWTMLEAFPPTGRSTS